MILSEMAGKLAGYRFEILATDLSAEVLERAKAGIYTQFEVQRGLPIQLLVKYFKKVGEPGRSRRRSAPWCSSARSICSTILRPLGTFDMVFCRNVLIYFDQADQGRRARSASRGRCRTTAIWRSAPPKP